MDTTLFLIDKIEGNSNIGVPVFSKLAQQQNFDFLALAPKKKEKMKVQNGDSGALLSKDLVRFKIKSPGPNSPSAEQSGGL